MRKQFSRIVKNFARDERGASLLEYTILLGIISAIAITTITAVGDWVADTWGTLRTQLGIS